MDIEEKRKKIVDIICKSDMIKKHLCKYTFLSGSSTLVYPIEVFKSDIIIQLNISKNVFKNFINRIENEYPEFIEYGYFSKNDGSCNSTLTFKFSKNLIFSK